MKKNEIEVGGMYKAKVSGKLTVVKVTGIKTVKGYGKSKAGTRYAAINTKTGREVSFSSAMSFSGRVDTPLTNGPAKGVESKKLAQTAPEAPVAKSAQFGEVLKRVLGKDLPEDLSPHIVAKAYAGTGKTFTEIVGIPYGVVDKKAYPDFWKSFQRDLAVRKNLNPDTFEIIPSQEQLAIWEKMAMSAGKVRTIVYGAFNKSIVTEFSEQWGWLVTSLQTVGLDLRFATINSLGNKDVSRAFGYLRVTDYHSENLISELLGRDPRELKREDPILVKATVELVGYCKLTLAGWTEEEGFDPEAVDEGVLDELCTHFDVELNGSKEKVYQLVPQVLRKSLDVAGSREIDYNDQNWLPVVLNLPVEQADLLMIDEGQDLPRCKQEYARRAGKRIMLVGDTNQAIYGFAGADVDSIPRMITLLGQDTRGVDVLGLTETRRCGKAIVKLANEIVPDFKAHDGNPEGKISNMTLEQYVKDIQDGDMVLCRVNAPIVSQALRLIKQGRKAIIRGRDFGQQLLSFIDRLKAQDVPDLIGKTDDWCHEESKKEMKKRNSGEAKLLAIQDRKDCIQAFCDGALSVQEVRERIALVFGGKECPRCHKHFNETSEQCFSCKIPLVTPKGIVFSSVHRAKGLEAKRVYILLVKGAGIPHPMAKSAWQKVQERNILYIAYTRAIEELVLVTN